MVAQSAISLWFAVLFGFWIFRIIVQSIDRRTVIAELEQAREELAAVSHRAGVLAERERLAREIHDTVAQGFTSVVVLLELAESDVDTDPAAARQRLAIARETARQNLAEARALVAALTPVDLQAAPLPEAIGRLVDRFAAETGAAGPAHRDRRAPGAAGQHGGGAAARGPGGADQRPQARRSRAGSRSPSTVRSWPVADDGAGFDPAAPTGGYGLAGMRRRVEEVGGTVSIAQRTERDQGGGAVLRVIVVDDHPVVREGLRAMLDAEPDLEVVGEAASGAEAVALAARLRPDVVLMDLRMPGIDGVTATGEIAATGDARVLVVTTYDTDADILRAVEAGATGYLLKDTPRRELAEAVRAAARGETVLAPPVARKLVSRVRLPAVESPTPRELEVLGAGRARTVQRGDRPGAAHQRGHGEDPPAARLRQARRLRPHRRGDQGHRQGPAPAAALAALLAAGPLGQALGADDAGRCGDPVDDLALDRAEVAEVGPGRRPGRRSSPPYRGRRPSSVRSRSARSPAPSRQPSRRRSRTWRSACRPRARRSCRPPRRRRRWRPRPRRRSSPAPARASRCPAGCRPGWG